MVRSSAQRVIGQELSENLFEQLPSALFVTVGGGEILARNPTARHLLGIHEGPASCCHVLGCCASASSPAGNCITDEALETGQTVTRHGVDVPGTHLTVTVLAVPLGSEGRVIVEVLRTPSEIGAEAAGPRPEHLRVRALGPLEIEGDGGELTGPWTHQRPGQVFGYLLANRGRTVFPDELAEALWADSGTGGLGTVRYFVHALRDRLEPKRNRWKTNRFVAFRGGGYVLNTAALGIDIDDFEAEVKAGLDASRQPEIAVPRLERALELYRGEFLSDHPYADWARPMRDQLHVMASGALRELIRHSAEAGEDERAAQLRRRLAELEPLDHDIHREVILEHLRNNRHSLAARRYDALRDRVQRELGHPPRFDLQQLSRQILEEVS